MARKLAFVVLALAGATPGLSVACEWHEMAAYGYGQPQRYSPFAQNHVTPAPEPQATPDESAPATDARSEQQRDQDTATVVARPRIPEENTRGLDFASRAETERDSGSR